MSVLQSISQRVEAEPVDFFDWIDDACDGCNVLVSHIKTVRQEVKTMLNALQNGLDAQDQEIADLKFRGAIQDQEIADLNLEIDGLKTRSTFQDQEIADLNTNFSAQISTMQREFASMKSKGRHLTLRPMFKMFKDNAALMESISSASKVYLQKKVSMHLVVYFPHALIHLTGQL